MKSPLALTVEQAALARLLDLRSSAPGLECSWSTEDDSAAPDGERQDEEAAGDVWLRRVWECPLFIVPTPGHGRVVLRGLYSSQIDSRAMLVMRGGLAICYVVWRRWRWARRWMRSVEGGWAYSISVRWIEPGIPDHVRRRERHDARYAARCAREARAATERLTVQPEPYDDADDRHGAGRERRREARALRGVTQRRLACAKRFLRIVARVAA